MKTCLNLRNIIASFLLNRNNQWKSAGNALKGGFVSLSGIAFRELALTITSTNNSFYTIRIPGYDIQDTVRTFKTGYYINADNYGGATVGVSKTRVDIQNVFEKGVSINDCRIFVYYLPTL